MFTGIIECCGTITSITKEQSNLHFTIKSDVSSQFKIDQSVAHNGVCLTVIVLSDDTHTVTAIDETLQKTNLKNYKINDVVNLERCMLANGRFDGHIVQGHVDGTAICKNIEDKNGSWLFTFHFENPLNNKLVVTKGSICINGTSLTVVDCGENNFSVAIIPYTFENTNFKYLKINDEVNIEFDVIGKYVQNMLKYN